MSIETYIKIPNQVFEPIFVNDVDTGTMFHRIGTIGFAVLSFLQIVQENKSSARIRPTDIKDILGLAKNETVIKYLNAIYRESLISIEGKTFGEKIKGLEFLNYSINLNYLNAPQFEPISIELFNKKIKQIGSDGWSVLCYLTKLHNYSFGNINSAGTISTSGYACPTLDLMRYTLNIGSKEKLTNILSCLEKEKLINILKSNEVSSYITASGATKFKRSSNKYVVINKIPGTAYYLSIKSSLHELTMKNKSEKVGV